MNSIGQKMKDETRNILRTYICDLDLRCHGRLVDLETMGYHRCFFVDLICYLSFSYYNVCFFQPWWHLFGKGFDLGPIVCDVFMFFVTFPYAVLNQVWYMIVSFLIFGFFFALSYEKLFDRKSYLVRNELMLVKGYLLTTNGRKIKE